MWSQRDQIDSEITRPDCSVCSELMSIGYMCQTFKIICVRTPNKQRASEWYSQSNLAKINKIIILSAN